MTGVEIWEPFLSPQDKSANGRGQRRAERGIGSNPALLLIDVYSRVFGDRREPLLEAIERFPSSCGPAAWDALPSLERLLGTSRDAGITVIHVTGASDIPGWREPRGGEVLDRGELEEAYRIREEVAPQKGETVIRKAAPSAFFGTPLVALLRQLGVDSVIVVGESTSGCVRATVVDACSHRFGVTVVEDCVFDRTEASHAINLFDMAQKYADVRGVDAVIEDVLNLQTAKVN